MCCLSDFDNLVTLLLLVCSISGTIGNLVIQPTGPLVVPAFVGSTVTLDFTYSGVVDPLVTWQKDALILATYTISSGAPPDVAPGYRGALSVKQNGALVLQNVSDSYSGMYIVQMAKSGEQGSSLSFTLVVYDNITSVSLNMEPQDVLEGGAPMTLTYGYQRGPASSSEWYFNGLQIRNNSRYSITQKSLTVSGPRRGDAGNYSVVLKNPLSTSNQSTKVSVLYGPDRPVLKVSPSQASFTSGENLSLSCGAAGEPVPIVSWVHQGRTLPSSSDGTLHLTNVQTSQSGTYTCVLSNSKTKAQHDGNVTIIVWGLSRSAIVAISAGIPCGILLLLVVIGLVYLCYYCCKKKDRNPKYPVAKAVEKAVKSQPDLNRTQRFLDMGLKPPPAYDSFHLQTFAERWGPLPSIVPPVRMATTV